MTAAAAIPRRDPQLALRDYQLQCLAAIGKAEARGVRRPLVALATGLGKTVLFAELIRRRGPRALVLAHREELLDQAREKIRAVAPELSVGIVQAERNELDADVLVGSVQTLAQPRRLDAVGTDFRTVVVDEAHHVCADSYGRILKSLGCFEHGGPLLLGVTATPQRGDRQGLAEVFEEIVFERDLLWGIENAWLCDVRAKRISLQVDLGSLRVAHGDYVAGQAGELLENAGAPDVIARAWREHAADRRGLVFVPTVALAHRCAAALRARGIPAEALDGTTAGEDRRAILARLRRGETRAVANCGVLIEGFDEPSINAIVMARPTRSQALYLQCLGRGTRPWPGKADCLLLDLCGVTARHDVVSLPSLLGIQMRDGEGVTEARERRARQEQAVRGRLVAQDVDLLRRRPAHWVPCDGGSFALSTGEGLLLLESTGKGFTVTYAPRDAEARTVASGRTLELAFGMAETWLRSAAEAERVRALTQPGARWREAAATPGQLAALERWRVMVPRDARGAPRLARGEAGDWLTRLCAERMLRARAARRREGPARAAQQQPGERRRCG